MLHTKFRADKSKREIVSELVKLGHSYEYAEAIFWENMKEMHDMELKEGISFKEIARHFNEHRLASLSASADAEADTQKGNVAHADALSAYQKAGDAYVAGNNKEAVKWYRLAADQGNLDAQIELGVMYYHGDRVSQDHAEAAKLYRLAADQGDGAAQFNLGLLYANGEGVPQDDVEAAKWYRLAADHGDEYAPKNLGIMYKEGTGVPKDDVMAYMWLNLAAALGDKSAKPDKKIIEKRLTKQQITEGQRLSREWFNEHR